jgi:hypothetical protein
MLTNLTSRKTLIDLASIDIKNGRKKGIMASRSIIPKNENT